MTPTACRHCIYAAEDTPPCEVLPRMFALGIVIALAIALGLVVLTLVDRAAEIEAALP
jgi:hypothetical protein